jgi:hypothetical protein
MYDEPWTLIAQLYDIMDHLLGADSRLEASVYGWSLVPIPPCCLNVDIAP